METEPTPRPLIKAAISSHGWTLLLVGLGTITLFAGTIANPGLDVQTWIAYTLLFAAGIITISLGVTAMRAAGPLAHAAGRHWTHRLVTVLSVMVFFMGLLQFLLAVFSNNASGSTGTGLLWIIAALLGFIAARRKQHAANADPYLHGALNLIAATCFTVGLSMVRPFNLSPVQHWSALGQFFFGIGTLGGIALLVLVITTILQPLAAKRSGPDHTARLGFSVAAILFGIATIQPSLGVLTNLQWTALTNPGTASLQAILLTTSLYALTAAFVAWTIASILTLLAAGVALLRSFQHLDIKHLWQTIRSLFTRPEGATTPSSKRGRRSSGKAQKLVCPNCKTNVQATSGERPVCPKCWYSGPSR